MSAKDTAIEAIMQAIKDQHQRHQIPQDLKNAMRIKQQRAMRLAKLQAQAFAKRAKTPRPN